ncbi:MAG: BREX-1 system adenine-specific DNA-methyltransferase PglX [Planctomycetaceae bacterium]|nr:BREX-1 system adenine-specific DNA-methyltransferase PglX [Planctomycetaceae bacterium]
MKGKQNGMRPEDLGTYYESILEKEVRKDGGIYYTPPPIVEYMVANSVGKLLKDKTPVDVANMKIVDPACGGGVFLTGAYQFLLDWHQKYFGKLTLAQRRKILTNNIFGVDIDPLAVEITKYCLSMKCSEGEDFSHDLDENIRCGNSLIETDIDAMPLNCGTEPIFKPFHWWREFPHVFQQGGFDIVIGNPPYGAKYSVEHKNYFLEHYSSAKTTTSNDGEVKIHRKGSLDTFSLFIENGFNRLKKNGFLTFIVPLAFVSSDSMSALHQLLFDHCETIWVSSYAKRPVQIFRDACTGHTMIGLTRTNTKCERLWTTRMNRLTGRNGLGRLLGKLEFTDGFQFCMRGRIPKISLSIEKRILKKLFAKKHTPIRDLLDNNGTPVYYRSSGGRYYNVMTNYPTGSTKEKSLCFDKQITSVIGAVLSSGLFWWYQQVYSNSLDLKSYEIESFPVPVDAFTAPVCDKIERLYEQYLQDMERHAVEHATKKYKHITTYKEYKLRYSKHLIDAIDDVVCPLYDLTEQECEFIKKFELRFRTDEQS